MKSELLQLFLPPFIGSYLLIGLVSVCEAMENNGSLEPCEMYTLSAVHYLILFLGSVLVGVVIQFTLIEQITKMISIHNFYHWTATGLILTLLIGTGITLLSGPQVRDHIFFSGYLLAAVYVLGALAITRKLKMKDSALSTKN